MTTVARCKQEIDRMVAARTGIGFNKVKVVTDSFLDIAAEMLVERRGIYLAHLGRLTLVVANAKRTLISTRWGQKRKVETVGHYRLYFAKSPTLKRRLENHYGKVGRSRGC